MDKYQAIYSFWSSFGVPAYEENSVPDEKDITFPYITYEAVSSPWESESIVSASVWTRSTSWTAADTIEQLIENRLKDGGEVIHYDGGIMWITPEDPFAQSMGDPDDDRIRRKLLTVKIQFH